MDKLIFLALLISGIIVFYLVQRKNKNRQREKLMLKEMIALPQKPKSRIDCYVAVKIGNEKYLFWMAYFDHFNNKFVPQMSNADIGRFVTDETEIFNNHVRFNKQIVAWCERAKFEALSDSVL